MTYLETLATFGAPRAALRSRRLASLIGGMVLAFGVVAYGEPGAVKPTPIFSVVIDAGHGGSNTGAPGRMHSTWEKRVTLGVARQLRRRLEARGVQVVMTRDRDSYLTLRERVRIANATDPDVFISLHTNASANHGWRGIETYVLHQDSVDVEARRAAAQVEDEVMSLVAELGHLQAHRAALQLASSVQKRLVKVITCSPNPCSVDRGVRQAGFDVLAGARSPAVLVEMGFLDHPVEGAELTRADGQARIAAAIADGILDYAGTTMGQRMASRR